MTTRAPYCDCVFPRKTRRGCSACDRPLFDDADPSHVAHRDGRFAKTNDAFAARNDEAPFAVLEWGSHPDAGNDDCWSGADYATEAEARAALDDLRGTGCAAYYELDGPDVHEVVRDDAYVPEADDDSDWRHEIAMQAGMGLGCDAYNDAMGY